MRTPQRKIRQMARQIAKELGHPTGRPQRIEYAGPSGVEILDLVGLDDLRRPIYGSADGSVRVVRAADGTLREIHHLTP